MVTWKIPIYVCLEMKLRNEGIFEGKFNVTDLAVHPLGQTRYYPKADRTINMRFV